MGPVRVVLVYAAAVFGGGALLAPLGYWSVQWLAEQWAWPRAIADAPFHRYVNRSVLLLALLGIWPLLHGLGMKDWKDAGVARLPRAGSFLALGFGLGFASLALVALAGLASGARRWALPEPVWGVLPNILGAMATAAVVATLEELLFRGAIFGGLRRACSLGVALGVSCGTYALVHFFRRPSPLAEVHWWSGFAVLGAMLQGCLDWSQLVPGFLLLLGAGLVLALAFERTGTLYASIGLHAGWVFLIKSYGLLTHGQPGANVWLWGSRKLIDGWVAGLVIAPLCLLVWRLPRHSSRAG